MFPNFSKVIILDFHGVLVEHSKWAMADFLGKLNCLFYSGDISARFNEFLATLEPNQYAKDNISKDASSQSFPKLLVEWQKGKKSSKDVVEELKKEIKKNNKFFTSNLEKEMITGICEAMLPDNLSKIVLPVDEMVRLLEEVNLHVDEKGNKKHKLIGLTNWDKESWPIVIADKKFKRLLDCFEKDHIVVSAYIGMAKPEEEIYKHVMEKFKLNPSECIFFDDQPANVESAKKLGLDAHVHSEYPKTRKIFEEKELLPAKQKKKPTWTSKKDKSEKAAEPKLTKKDTLKTPAKELSKTIC